jgi:hypothetical protein
VGNLAISHLEGGRDGRIVFKWIVRTSFDIVHRVLRLIN